MRHGLIAAMILLALAGCVREAPSATPAAVTPGPRMTEVLRASRTATGAPIPAPPTPVEAVVSVTELDPGGILPMHRHRWPRTVYVDRGRIAVRYEEGGATREFGAGDAIVEAVGEWHEGRVIGGEGVRIIVFDMVPPGATNVDRR